MSIPRPSGRSRVSAQVASFRRTAWMLSFLLVLYLAAGALSAQTSARSESQPASLEDARLSRALDSLFSDAYPQDEPGASVLVLRDGKVLLRDGYGMANLELGVPIEPDMVFRLGSITKQFTAVAILMLAADGKLSLDAPMTTYLPDYPETGDKITVHHLLTHLSGIPSYTGMDGFMSKVRNDLGVDEMIAFFQDEPLEFEPGERFAYNNSAYFLLGAIIEQVSGESYAELIARRIFEPLGMESSFYGDPARVIPRRAAGYAGPPGAYRNAPYLSMTQPYAAGSLLSTVDDLARWDAALYTDQLLSREWRDKLWTPARLNDGRSVYYGYGWQIWEYDGHPVIEHGGGIFGFVTSALRLPADRIFVAVLSNNPTKPVRQAAFAAVTEVLGKPLAERPRISLTPKEREAYLGVYLIEGDPEATRMIRWEDGSLTSQRSGGRISKVFFLRPDEMTWEDSATTARFERDASGKVTGMRLRSNLGPDEWARRTDRPIPAGRRAIDIDPAIFDAYVGRYELAPGFVMTVTREGQRFFAQATGQRKLEIFAESDVRFFPTVVDATLEFRDIEDGRAGEMVLFQGGREVPGKRVDDE